MAYESLRSIEGPTKPRKKVKRKPSTPITVTATLGGAGQRATERAARKARRPPKPAPITVTATTGAEGQRRVERQAKKAKRRERKREARREERKVERVLREGTRPVEVLRPGRGRGGERFVGAQARGPVIQKQSALDFIADEAEKTVAQGVLARTGVVSKKTAGDVREALTGSRNPTPIELGIAAAPIPAVKGATVARALLRSPKALRTTERAVKATEAAQKARQARKAERTTKVAKAPTKAGKAKATAAGMGKGAKGRLGAVEQKARAARAADRAVKAATNPALAAAAASPGEIGDKTRAAIEGIATANIPKSAKTTLSAIPAVFSYLGTVGAAAGTAAATGDTDALEAAGEQGWEGLKALEVYASGDPEAIKKATEEEIGYAFAPLVPRGFASAPARAAGRGAVKAAAATGRGTAKAYKGVRGSRPVVKMAGEPRPPKAKPGPLRRARQLIMGKPRRRRMAEIGGRTMGAAGRGAVIAQRHMTKHASKLGRKHGPEAESLIPIGIEHGLTPNNPGRQLAAIERSHADTPDDPLVPNEQKALAWAREHPEVFDDSNLWKGIEEGRRYADEISTSESAPYVAQGRVAGVTPRHERVPARAREMTGAETRTGAWEAHRGLGRTASERRAKAGKLRARAQEHKGQRAQTLRAQARIMERGARRSEAEAGALHDVLDPFTRPEHSIALAQRQAWSPQMAREFIRDVEAARDPAATRPGYVSGRADDELIGEMGGPKVPSVGPRVSRRRTGESGATDIVDRSFPAYLAKSVTQPRLQRGVNEFIRQTFKEFRQAIPGTKRYVVDSTREANDLIRSGAVDPREFSFVPIRHFKQSMKAERFDLGGYHSKLIDDLNAEIGALENRPGTKYLLMKREDAIEFAEQINPNVAGLEAAAAGAATVGTRLILGTNPAWLEAQFINEATQAGVAVSPLKLLRSRKTLGKYGKENPRGREAFRAMAGDSPAAIESPTATHQHMVTNHADAYEAYRYDHMTPVGKFLRDLATLKTLGKIDRWKTGKLRESTLAGTIDREINGLVPRARREVRQFIRGLAGMQDMEYRISKELRGMTRTQQLDWAQTPKGRKFFRKHLDYLDDVNGNWDSFTRFERRFSPITMFYPYIRMSLRWSFGSYAKHHPVKAQILYLLAQSNRDELAKLLGREPTFFESAIPVVYDTEGKVSDVLPGGRRFGAPGSNAIVEAVGDENLRGLTRALNPVIQMGLSAITGVDPYTGERSQFTGNLGDQLLDRGIEATRQFLSLAGPARIGAGPLPEVGRLGEEENAATRKFEQYDPNRDLRSLAIPFLPQSKKGFKRQQKTSEAFRAGERAPKSPTSQLYDLVDTVGYEEAERRLREAAKSGAYLEGEIKYPETDDPKMDRLIDLMYELQTEGAAAPKPKVKRRGGFSVGGGSSGGGVSVGGGGGSSPGGGFVIK